MREKKLNISFFLFILYFFIPVLNSNAQNSFDQIEKLELYSVEDELLNGEMWIYNKKYDGHPFWNKNIWYRGTLVYKDVRFEDLALRYDINTDDVIVFKKSGSKGRSFKLNKQHLSEFSLTDPSANNTTTFEIFALPGNKTKGIFSVAYNGDIKYYIHYQKIVSNKVSENYTGEYLLKPQLVAIANGQAKEFDSKRELLSLFQDKKKVIKKFMRQNKIKLKTKSPEKLSLVFQYYDSLNKSTVGN